MLNELLYILLGIYLGHYGPKYYYKVKHYYHLWKVGICFHFKGKGYREIIDGTDSEFCINCGKPYGYHD